MGIHSGLIFGPAVLVDFSVLVVLLLGDIAQTVFENMDDGRLTAKQTELMASSFDAAPVMKILAMQMSLKNIGKRLIILVEKIMNFSERTAENLLTLVFVDMPFGH